MTPEAQKRKAAEAQARRGIDMDAPTRGGWVDDLGAGGFRLRCLVGFNSGPPITPSAYNNNLQLFQTRDHVAILSEMIHDVRIVPLDGRAHGNLRLWAGDSRGRWEGDTLIVDSVNFRAATIPYDWFTIGSPYEFVQKTHLVERFRRVDADTLLYEFTVDNPSVWTKPWTAQVPMTKSQLPLYEYACHEGNYSLPSVLAGARAEEQAEESAQKRRR